MDRSSPVCARSSGRLFCNEDRTFWFRRLRIFGWGNFVLRVVLRLAKWGALRFLEERLSRASDPVEDGAEGVAEGGGGDGFHPGEGEDSLCLAERGGERGGQSLEDGDASLKLGYLHREGRGPLIQSVHAALEFVRPRRKPDDLLCDLALEKPPRPPEPEPRPKRENAPRSREQSTERNKDEQSREHGFTVACRRDIYTLFTNRSMVLKSSSATRGGAVW